MYRRYTTLHLLITMGAFSVAAVWIALSASRHNQAKSQCETDFFSGTTQDSQADTLCNIFPWVSIGLMGGLWVVLAIAQVSYDHRVIGNVTDHNIDLLLCRYLVLRGGPTARPREI